MASRRKSNRRRHDGKGIMHEIAKGRRAHNRHSKRVNQRRQRDREERFEMQQAARVANEKDDG